MIIPVILCGGSGTRLWPMSRKNCPKQFLNLTDKHLSLFQKTILRLPKICSKPIIICNESHRFIVSDQLKAINKCAQSIILEPFGKNTAPAIAICALEALSISSESSILVLSADHEIKDTDSFHKSVSASIKPINKNLLVAFGVKPTRPETGYGYIKKSESNDGIFPISSFEEKPDYDKALDFLNSDDYFWNSGIFAMKAKLYLEELKKYEFDLFMNCKKVNKGLKDEFGFKKIDKTLFKECKDISIDYAVMERTSNAVLLNLDAKWSDVGSWESLWLEKNRDKFGNIIDGDIYTNNVSNSYIKTEKKFTAVIGLENIIVVDTSDALLVSDKSMAHHTKEIVNHLKEDKREEYQNHKKVHRPWGYFESLEKQEGYQVKLLSLNPGAKISLQKHEHRSEHWVVISGEATITCGELTKKYTKNQSTFIPQGTIHRLENESTETLKVIEVQTGDYLGEDDIIRIEDIYKRDG